MNDIKIDKIIRSKRKSIALIVTSDASLIIRAPLFTPMRYINDLINKKGKWIKSKQEIAKKKLISIVKKEFVKGEGFLYIGKSYKLDFIKGQIESIIFEDKISISETYRYHSKIILLNWYKQKALEKISERVKWYSIISGYKYTSIRITNAKKRWGSCNSKGYLNFSWRLIMAPINVIDYVVIHELVHIEEKNHSRNFWNKVKIIMPDYKRNVEWLKENNNKLNL